MKEILKHENEYYIFGQVGKCKSSSSTKTIKHALVHGIIDWKQMIAMYHVKSLSYMSSNRYWGCAALACKHDSQHSWMLWWETNSWWAAIPWIPFRTWWLTAGGLMSWITSTMIRDRHSASHIHLLESCGRLLCWFLPWECPTSALWEAIKIIKTPHDMFSKTIPCGPPLTRWTYIVNYLLCSSFYLYVNNKLVNMKK